MFKVIKKEGKARRGVFTCAHGGEVQTPVFMNVGTQAAIKGGVSAIDLEGTAGDADRIVQHIPPASAAGRRRGAANGRTS